MSFGAIPVYGYDSENQYEKIRQENQLQDIQYQLYEIREQLERQRIQDQLDRLYDNCGYDCDCW